MKKLISILILLFSISCSEETLQKAVDDSSSDMPILSFKSAVEMNTYLRSINTNSGSLNGRSKSSKFESFDDIYKKASQELSLAQTNDEVARLLKTYADVVTLLDSTFIPTMQNKLYRTICNRERIYESEGYVHKVLDDQFIVISKKENLNSLRKINVGDKLDQSAFNLTQYSDLSDGGNSGRTQADVCANEMQYYLEYNPSGCKNDRRVYARTSTNWIISGNNYTPHLIAETFAKRRAGTFCFWYFYNTVFHTRDADIRVRMVINGITYNFILSKANGSIPDYNLDGLIGEVEDYSLYNNDLQTGPTYWSSGPAPVIGFTKAFFEASSRGTGDNNWVSVDCVQ